MRKDLETNKNRLKVFVSYETDIEKTKVTFQYCTTNRIVQFARTYNKRILIVWDELGASAPSDPSGIQRLMANLLVQGCKTNFRNNNISFLALNQSLSGIYKKFFKDSCFTVQFHGRNIADKDYEIMRDKFKWDDMVMKKVPQLDFYNFFGYGAIGKSDEYDAKLDGAFYFFPPRCYVKEPEDGIIKMYEKDYPENVVDYRKGIIQEIKDVMEAQKQKMTERSEKLNEELMGEEGKVNEEVKKPYKKNNVSKKDPYFPEDEMGPEPTTVKLPRESMGQMSEDNKETVELFTQGFSYRDIALKIGKKEASVRVVISRWKKRNKTD